MPSGVAIQELRGQIEISNFQATCTVTTGKCKNAQALQEDVEKYIITLPTDPVFGTDGKQFLVILEWEAERNARGHGILPNTNGKMGLNLRLMRGHCECFVKLEAEIINKDPAHNMVRRFEDFYKISQDKFCGWGPSLAKAVGFNNGFMKLGDVLKPSCGWLHEGGLRINLKLEVAIENESPSIPTNASNCLVKLSKDFGNLLSRGDHSDMIIKVKDEELRAHSSILIARSSVFAAMLSSSMREATEKVVTINDLDVAAVRALVAFIYTGEIDDALLKSDADALGVLQAAHRYDVPSLVDLCVQSLSARFDVTTVSEWLYLADLVGEAAFRAKCLQFIRLHITEVQGTDNFSKFIATRPALLTEILAALFPPTKRQRCAE